MNFIKYAEQFISYQGKPIPTLTEPMINSVYNAAYLAYEQGSYQHAEELFLYLLCNQPTQPSFWKGFASAQQMQKKYKSAKQAWMAFLVLVENNSEGLFHLAECLLSLNSPKECLIHLEKILLLEGVHEALVTKVLLLKTCAQQQVKIHG